MSQSRSQSDRVSWQFLRRLRRPGADDILRDLTDRQHLSPHRPVGQVLAAAATAVGFCPQAGEAAVAWLQINPAAAVGRLRRTELAQLARCIHRIWRRSRAAEPAERSSAAQTA